VGEAQTLTSGAEHNMLKLAELRGVMSPEQEARWQEIKRGFARVQAMGGGDDDPVARVSGTIGLVSDRLADIAGRIDSAAKMAVQQARPPAHSDRLGPILDRLGQSISEMAAERARVGAASEAPQAPAIGTDSVSTLADQLATLAKGLDGIGQAIVTASSARPEELPQARPETGSTAAATDLSPYLQKLDQTLAGLASAAPSRGGVQIIQTLQPGVHDLLEEMSGNIETGLLETLRAISRKVKRSKKAEDQHLDAMINRMLKNFDMLKDLVQALRRLDSSEYLKSEPPTS
jgi:hypothetical protein